MEEIDRPGVRDVMVALQMIEGADQAVAGAIVIMTLHPARIVREKLQQQVEHLQASGCNLMLGTCAGRRLRAWQATVQLPFPVNAPSSHNPAREV